MPLQNRVTPMGNIVAEPERGMFTGNRGIIHDPLTRTLLNRRWASQAWLICTLQWRGIRRSVMGTRSWTELFFLDEATALAAGHRPCFECRRAEARAFQAAFRDGAPPRAPEMDRVLHGERLDGARKRLWETRLETLPDGAMIDDGGCAFAVRGDALLPWSFVGYGAPRLRPRVGAARALTPPSILRALAAGYRPRWAEPLAALRDREP